MPLFNTLVSKTIMHIPGPIVGFFAKGYIAGEQLSDAVQVGRQFNRQGLLLTLDILGEAIATREEALYFKDQCLQILATIQKEQLDASLSLKATQMGLLLDEQFAFTNIREIVAKATELNSFVRLDMEDHRCTDKTLEFYRRLRKDFPQHVGVALQAYLRRTLQDIKALSDQPMQCRLCKGIYNEPRSIAWKDPDIINRSFVECLKRMFAHGAYVGIATHDEKLIFEALRLIDEYGLSKEQYEFQMLLGVDPELRRILLEAGHRLRIYLPYGTAWLPYSRRRLKENPSIARHALRQFIRERG